jgi:enoyl-CoA hydratase
MTGTTQSRTVGSTADRSHHGSTGTVGAASQPGAGASGLVAWSVTAGVAVLTLNDAARRNALSPQLSLDLAQAVGQALNEDVGAIVLTATSPVFSAGGDLEALSRQPVPLDEMYEGFLALANAPVPTLAVVDGPAVGAGLNLALACDVVLTTPRAVFDPRFIDAGMHPGGGHLWRLDHRVGRQGTAALVLFGAKLTGDEAVARGLAWLCLPPEHVLDVAMDMATTAAGRDRELVNRTKATMKAGDAITTPSEAVAVEREAQRWAVTRPTFTHHLAVVQARMAEAQKS